MSGVVWLGITLLVAWLVLLAGYHVTSGAIHLQVLIAVFIIVLGITGRGDPPPDGEP